MPLVWWPGKTWNSGSSINTNTLETKSKNEQKATENSVCDAIEPSVMFACVLAQFLLGAFCDLAVRLESVG